MNVSVLRFSIICAVLAVGITLPLVGCPTDSTDHDEPDHVIEPTPPTKAEVDAARAQAEKAENRLVQVLMQRLTGALDAGPPEQALAVCSDEAQSLTRQIASETGVTIRRTTLKLRNPTNAPDEWERTVLEAWAAADGAPELVEEVVTNEAGKPELRRMKPLMLAGMCLTCHGDADAMSSALTQTLAERYPDDQATGYEAGQLRGAISTRLRVD